MKRETEKLHDEQRRIVAYLDGLKAKVHSGAKNLHDMFLGIPRYCYIILLSEIKGGSHGNWNDTHFNPREVHSAASLGSGYKT